MATDLNELFRVTKKQIKPAVETLTKAFENAPLYSYLIPDEEERKKLLPYFFKFRILYGISYGEVYTNSPHVEGVAVWIPRKNVNMTQFKILRSGGLKLYFKASKDVMTRISLLNEYLSESHKKYADFPHWFLAPIGVKPIYQGKGFGSILIRLMLDRLDREHLPCFLETQSEYNVLIYERFGFKVVEEGKIPGTNLTSWAMLRDKR